MATTTTTATAAQTELTELLVQHFDDHQRQVDIKDHVVDARAREIIIQVDELTARQSLENLALMTTKNDNDNEPSLEDTLATTLTRFLDCAMASTDNEDSSSSSSASASAVDAILALCAAVAARSKKSVVMNAVLQRTVEYSTVLLERVRCAACRCIGWIVQSLLKQQQQQSQQQVDNSLASLLDTASQALVPRFIDKSQAVRLAAISAAGFFFSSSSGSKQEDDYDDDPDLRTSLQWALQHDASVANRIAALQCLPVTVQTMDVILSRLRDVKRKVRIAALQILQRAATNVLTLLDASQCAGIVQAGMADRDEEVQNETIKLICTSWMKTAKFNPITIIKHLNVVDYEEACEKVIQVLLDANDEILAEQLSDPEIRAYWQGIENATTPVVVTNEKSSSPSPPQPGDLLDVDMVFFARARCQYVKDTNRNAKNVTTTRQAEAILTKVLPDIPVLCEIFELHSAALIKTVVAAAGQDNDDDDDDDMMENNSNNRRSSALSSTRDAEKNQDALTLTCLQLLQMACMSSSEMEEGSRLHLKATMTSMLGSIITPDDVVEGCIVTLQAIHVDEGEFCTSIFNIVHQLHRDYEQVASGDDGLNDNRLLRILSILSILLEKGSLQIASSPSILANFATLIVPAVSCETNELVREAAVSCLGKLGLFTPEQTVLRDFKPLLLKIVPNEDETLEIRAQAMLALCDWSILFNDALGPCQVVANADNDNSTTLVAFPDLVFEMMAHEELGMVCVAAEVACKLLTMGKICNSSWLARLVTLFFDVRLNDDDEVMEDNDDDHPDATAAAASQVGSPIRLQQLLSLFFPAYGHKSEQNRHVLVEAISMILDSLLALHSQKRKRGAKAPVSVAKVLDYVVDTVYSADQTVQENLKSKDLEKGSQETTSQFSTPVLMAAIQMASFLSKEHDNCKVLFLRTICKHLGSLATNLQVEREKDRDLSVLMDLMQEVGMEITDATCLKSLAPLNAFLDNIELDDEVVDDKEEEASQDDGDAESIADAMQTMAITPTTRLDKENQSKDSRRGVPTSSSGDKHGGSGERQRRQRLSNSNE